jgi:CheY-like chemotaxis protein
MADGETKQVILVGEDDKFLSNVYKTKLAKEGFQVEHGMDGKEVLRLALEKKPDLILLDLIMPVMDGFETLAGLKANPETKDIKVVILSNLSQEEDMKKVMALGAVEYVVKANVSFKEVIECAKKHLAS